MKITESTIRAALAAMHAAQAGGVGGDFDAAGMRAIDKAEPELQALAVAISGAGQIVVLSTAEARALLRASENRYVPPRTLTKAKAKLQRLVDVEEGRS